MPGADAWSGQHRLLEAGLPAHDTVVERIANVPRPWPRFLGALLYMTAARASEILKTDHDTLPMMETENIKGHACIKFTIRNEKNRTQRIKILAMRIDQDAELCKILINYKCFLDEMPRTHQAIHRITKKAYGWNPHYFRHLRLTHLAVDKNYSDTKLSRFAGWTDARPASTYVKYKYPDFIED